MSILQSIFLKGYRMVFNTEYRMNKSKKLLLD